MGCSPWGRIESDPRGPATSTGSLASQRHPTLRDPMGCSPPGSSVQGIFQARVLEKLILSYLGLMFSDISSSLGLCPRTSWETP